LLSTETNNVRFVIQLVLSALLDQLQKTQFDLTFYENIMWKQFSSDASRQAKLTAIKYVQKLFPFDHALSKVWCLSCTGDSLIEIREEALVALKVPFGSAIPSVESIISMVELFKSRTIPSEKLTAYDQIFGLSKPCMINFFAFIRNLMLANCCLSEEKYWELVDNENDQHPFYMLSDEEKNNIIKQSSLIDRTLFERMIKWTEKCLFLEMDNSDKSKIDFISNLILLVQILPKELLKTFDLKNMERLLNNGPLKFQKMVCFALVSLSTVDNRKVLLGNTLEVLNQPTKIVNFYCFIDLESHRC
jgi:hypothetical protein